MSSAFHQLCPRYSGTLTPTAPTAIRLWDTFTLWSHITKMAIMPIFGIKENLTNHLQNQMEEHIECVLNTGTLVDVMNALQHK